jgi:hypothetical protein
LGGGIVGETIYSFPGTKKQFRQRSGCLLPSLPVLVSNFPQESAILQTGSFPGSFACPPLPAEGVGIPK